VAFAWKLLRDRIPTRVNLSGSNVLPPDSSVNCVMYEGMPEASEHLFLNCAMAKEVWAEILRWLGFDYHTPPDFFVHWKWWNELSGNKKIRMGYRIIWHAAI